MSSNQAQEVIAMSDDGEKQGWFQGRFYRKEGNKYVLDSKVSQGVFVSAVLILLIGVMFKDTSSTKRADTVINPPDRVATYQHDITLNVYSDTDEKKSETQKRRQVKFERLSLVSSTKKLEIPLGAQARGVLVTGGTNGPVKVRLLEDLISHGEVFIKEGAILWGRGSSTDERLLISFTKYVDENGKARKITANAFDMSDQILGLKGSVIGRTSKKLLSGAGLGVAGALQTMQQTDNLGGMPVVRPNLENAMLNGASTVALGMAEQELEELKNKQNVIEVKKGTRVMIVFGGM